MAQPILFEPPVRRDASEAERVENAPAQHAEAVLSAFELLQELHDKGILELLRGAVGAGDKIVGTLTTAVDTPEAIRGMRNFLLLTQFFASIPPEVLHSLVATARAGAEREKMGKAPGLWSLFKRLRSENARHATAVMLDLVESVGKGL